VKHSRLALAFLPLLVLAGCASTPLGVLVPGFAHAADALVPDAPFTWAGALAAIWSALTSDLGIAGLVATVTKIVTGWARDTKTLRNAPAWLVGSEPGKVPTGWRCHVLVFLIAGSIYALKDTAAVFAATHALAWPTMGTVKEAFGATVLAVWGNEFLKHGVPSDLAGINKDKTS
jgi:hypothetical protein